MQLLLATLESLGKIPQHRIVYNVECFFILQVISKDIDHLYMSGDEEERKSIQQTSHMFAAQITQLLFKVPRVLLLLLKTNDCLRSVDLALGEVRTWI